MRSSGLVLFICAGLLLSGGVILGGSAAWNLLRMSYYFWTTDLGVELVACVIAMAGALLCLPTCWLATVVPYHPKCNSLVATLMTLATASMLTLAVGVSSMAGVSRALREPAGLNASMARAMAVAGFDPAVRSAFSTMQMELKCCGVQSSSDWYQYRSSLPAACCGRMGDGKRSDQCVSPTYTMGCLRPALYELRNFANSITIFGSAIILVLAVTLFAAAYLLVSQVLASAELRFKPQPLRIACVPPPHAPGSLFAALATAPSTPITQV